MEHLYDDQRITLTLGQLLRIVREASLSEGGNRPNEIGAGHRKDIINTLCKHVLPNAMPECTQLLKTKEDFGGYKYAVVDVENQRKSYDIVIQKLEDGIIVNATLQSKASSGSYMLQKVLDFQIDKGADGGYQIGMNQAKNHNLGTQSEKDFWKAVETDLSDKTKGEVLGNIAKVVSTYDKRYEGYRRRKGDGFQTWLDAQPLIRFGNRNFVKAILDKILPLKESIPVSSPFPISIDKYVTWLQGVHYIQIGYYLFGVSTDNPLNLTNRKGADIPNLEDHYAGIIANFAIGKGKTIRPLTIHAYGIKEKLNPDYVSLVIPELYPSVS